MYSDWLDACDAVAKDAANRDDGARQYSVINGRVRRSSVMESDMNAKLGTVDDEEDGEGDYDND